MNIKEGFSGEIDRVRIDMGKIAPLRAEGYQAEGKDQFYDRKTAFGYMDGAAELYLSYRFKLLMVRRYLKPNSSPLILECFNMCSSEEAFGIFSYQTEEKEVGIGQGSEYGGGLLRFWKGKYFINLYAEKTDPSSEKDILGVGEIIAKRIRREGSKPKMIQFLPKEGLLERTIRYFHLHQILNHHYFISHENLLNLSEGTQAILATYLLSQGKDKTYLLLIKYPEAREARKASNRFRKAYLPEAITSKPIQMENGKWTSMKLIQNYLVVIFDAPYSHQAERLIDVTSQHFIKRSDR
ncbi:MAG: DUF6599 family protein [Thermodesulfobacteriota bacterium]